MMDALTLLPVDKVENGMTFLGQNCCTGAEDLLEYFDINYVVRDIPEKTNDR